jgi:ankyrin repeat protein
MSFLLRTVLTLSCFCSGCHGALDVPSNVSKRANEIFLESHACELAEAAARGDVRRMEKLVKDGVSVDSKGLFDLTPAWWAIRNRNREGFAWLLAHGANPNPDVNSITTMEMAAGYEDSEFLQIALKYKPDLNLVSRYTHKSPLHTAIIYGRRNNLELLIKAGADLNQSKGGFPLTRAAQSGCYDYVFLMLKAGADPAETATLKHQVSLQRAIEVRVIDPDKTDAYEWRERVIRILHEKGIEAHRPEREPARTKPLPPDLADKP